MSPTSFSRVLLFCQSVVHWSLTRSNAVMDHTLELGNDYSVLNQVYA